MESKDLNIIGNDYRCTCCGRKLDTAKMKWIGFCCEAGEYTLDDSKATQGFFPFGSRCYTRAVEALKNGKQPVIKDWEQ